MPASEVFWFLFERWRAFVLAERSLRTYLTLGIVFLAALLLEIVLRRAWKPRYFSRSFLVDVLYFVFYYGGIYHVLVFFPLYALMTRLLHAYAPWLSMNLMADAAPGWKMVVAILVADFGGYWWHRAMHGNRVLWMFHSVHHSQERLTVMTNYRFHFVDETLLRMTLFIPFQIVGADFKIWLTVDLLMAWILLFQHSEWNWTYGPVGRLFVSPRFHQIHHSTDPDHHNRNFAMLLSVWDDLFGTSERRGHPKAFGIFPERMPESFFGQFAWPFARLVRGWRPVAVIPPTEQTSGS